MPSLAPPPPQTTPTTSPGHHAPPAPKVPTPPTPRPLPVSPLVPVAIGVGVALKKFGVCPFSDSDKAKKYTPKTEGKKKNPKQQRPCGGQNPIVTYSKRRRAVGTIRVSRKFRSWTIKRELKYKNWKRDNYDSKGQDVELEIDLVSYVDYQKKRQQLSDSKLRDLFLDLRDGASADTSCFYIIYETGKRRHCRCPDGSKCKR